MIFILIMQIDSFRDFIRIFLEGGMGISRNMSMSSKHSAKYRNNKNYPFHKNYPLKEIEVQKDLTEISPEEIKIPKEFIHDTLNPRLWNEDKTLKPDVWKKTIEIVREFYKYLNVDCKVESVRLVGSLANYNWSSQSDIDIHLFFDFSDINSDTELVDEYFKAKKSLWNENHSIKIKDFPVELYCNSINDNLRSSGVYDLLNRKWIKEPTRDGFEIDKTSLAVKTASIISAIENLEDNRSLTNDERHDKAIVLKDKIKKMRESGLETGGEFSIENLSFKYLRNNDYIQKLYDIIQTSFDKKLSLD